MNLEKITRQVCDLCREVGQFISKEGDSFSQKYVQYKGLHDLVSYVDQQAEQQLVAQLHQIIPEAGFIVEENKQLQKSAHLNWIIDPLDGTTNFIHGIPVYSISIALMDKEAIILGVVYEINRDECFYSWTEADAFLNGKPIVVSKTDQLEQSLLATGFPYADYSQLDPYMALFKELMETTRGIRRLGSAAVDLAYVACGRFDLFYEYGLNPWDVAAGAFLVKQAGGHITDFRGGSNCIFGREIVASNTCTHDEFLVKLKTKFHN